MMPEVITSPRLPITLKALVLNAIMTVAILVMTVEAMDPSLL